MTTKKPGYIVACMECHNGKLHSEDTLEQAEKWAEMHLSIGTGHKDHSGHTVTITKTTLVRKA